MNTQNVITGWKAGDYLASLRCNFFILGKTSLGMVIARVIERQRTTKNIRGRKMVGIVIVAHENFAGALLATAEQIAGKQEQVVALSFPSGESIADLMLRIQCAVKKVNNKQGVLLFADLLGGSPYQAAAMVAMQERGVELVAGINLPMLLEILPARKEQQVADVTAAAVRGGYQGIKKFVKFSLE